MTDRSHLVIVRAGDKSLHPEWLKGDGPRSWDLVVNYYGDDPDRYRQDGVERIDSKGPKWPALQALFQARSDLVSRYSHVWLPDDDLLADKDSINRLFRICADHGLEAAQPALSWDSYSSHLLTLRHANTTIRYTNFVEVMAPCLSAGMLAKSLPMFAETLSGWGLDFIWSTLADNPEAGIGIIDAVTVRHTRPVGGPNYKTLEAEGVLPLKEGMAFLERHGIEPVVNVHKVLDKQGRVRKPDKRPRQYGARLLIGCLPAVRHAPDWKRLTQRIARSAFDMLIIRPHVEIDGVKPRRAPIAPHLFGPGES